MVCVADTLSTAVVTLATAVVTNVAVESETTLGAVVTKLSILDTAVPSDEATLTEVDVVTLCDTGETVGATLETIPKGEDVTTLCSTAADVELTTLCNAETPLRRGDLRVTSLSGCVAVVSAMAALRVVRLAGSVTTLHAVRITSSMVSSTVLRQTSFS